MDRKRTALAYLGATLVAALFYAVLYSAIALPGGTLRLLGIVLSMAFSLSPVMVALNTARELFLMPSLRTVAAVILLGVHLYFAGRTPAPVDRWRRIGFRALQGALGPVLVVPYVYLTPEPGRQPHGADAPAARRNR